MILQSRQWGLPLDLTLIVLGLLTVSSLPGTSDDFLIICSSSLLLPYILFAVYFLLLLLISYMLYPNFLSTSSACSVLCLPPESLHSWHFIVL